MFGALAIASIHAIIDSLHGIEGADPNARNEMKQFEREWAYGGPTNNLFVMFYYLLPRRCHFILELVFSLFNGILIFQFE